MRTTADPQKRGGSVTLAFGAGSSAEASAPARDGTHGQRVLLIDGVQLLRAHGVSDEVKLLRQRLAAVRHADVRNVGAADVVALGTFLVVVRAEPVALSLKSEDSFMTSLASNSTLVL